MAVAADHAYFNTKVVNESSVCRGTSFIIVGMQLNHPHNCGVAIHPNVSTLERAL